MEAQKIGKIAFTKKRQSRYQVNHVGEAQVLATSLTVTHLHLPPMALPGRPFCSQQTLNFLAQVTQHGGGRWDSGFVTLGALATSSFGSFGLPAPGRTPVLNNRKNF